MSLHLSLKPLFETQKKIEQLAREFSKRFSFKYDDSINSLVQKLGGNIVCRPSRLGLVVYDRDEFDIIPPTLTSLSVDKMFIAQAIGYYWLYYETQNDNGCFACKRIPNPDNGDEKLAYAETIWFGQELLLPRKEFTDIYQKHGAEKAVSVFQFPLDDILNRAEMLNIL